MKKKFTNSCLIILGVLIIVFAVLLTPAAPLITTGIKALSDTDYTYTAPSQDTNAFQQTTTTYDLNDWQKNTNNYLTATQVTKENNDSYHNNTTHQNITLSSEQLNNREPIMLLANTKNFPTSGSISTTEITLPANGYYTVAVKYQIMGQAADHSYFYLGDDFIPLQPQGYWRTALFLVQTDRLTATTLPARLYLGSPTQNVYGAAYYCDFTVTTLTASAFNDKVEHRDPIDQIYLDFTNKTEVELVKTVPNTGFSAGKGTQQNVIATNCINNYDVATALKFTDGRTDFYTKDGRGDVMLMAATGNNTALTLTNYSFKPLPHEVYMFQFYSIMPSDLSQFYFCIGDTYQKIMTVDYPAHNGWQLNTVFYTAGHEAVQEFTLSFTLANKDETTITGWVALDNLQIYRVTGDYATANSDALGVQDVIDQNSADNWTIANGSFELGTATGLPTATTYPYPLKANSWTTEQTDNGIVNTEFWKFDGIDNPGVINKRYDVNNNIYMLRNTNVTVNQVTSPTLTTAVGATTYFSFDAYAKDGAPLYVSFQTSDGVELYQFTINNNAWQHYELAVTEHANAVSRSYQLVFTLKNVGTAFLDNFRSESEPYQFDDKNTTATETVDLTSPVKPLGLWQVTDSALSDKLATGYDNDGITLRNEDQATVEVQYGLNYTMTADGYYQISVTARGENAFMELSGFDGYFTVKTDANDATALTTYNFYCHPTDAATMKFLVTLGSKEANTYHDGNLYLTALTFTSLEETDYNLAVKNLGDHDQVIKVAATTTDEPTTDDNTNNDANNFFGENWWFLIPTLITALAVILAVISFLWHRLKFDKHVTNKNTSYARDMKLKTTHKKIVAEKPAKVDNITDETPHNN